MVFCSSCDGVPLNLKRKNKQASSLAAQILSLLLTPLRIRWTIPLISLEYYNNKNIWFTAFPPLVGIARKSTDLFLEWTVEPYG
jgi:hypothetical protein